MYRESNAIEYQTNKDLLGAGFFFNILFNRVNRCEKVSDRHQLESVLQTRTPVIVESGPRS